MLEILPYLVNGDTELARTLIDFFMPFLQWDTCDGIRTNDNNLGEISPDLENNKFYVNIFIKFCEILGHTATVFASNEDPFVVIRNVTLNEGLLASCLQYCVDNLSNINKINKNEQIANLNKMSDALPIVLQILAGMIKGHTPSQNLAVEMGVLKGLHAIEKMSTNSGVGPMAETVLNAIIYNNSKNKVKVDKLRNKSKDKKQKKAQKKREKLLANMKQSDKNLKLFDNFVDEPSELQCMVCHEGYHLKPTELLGIYVCNKVCCKIVFLFLFLFFVFVFL